MSARPANRAPSTKRSSSATRVMPTINGYVRINSEAGSVATVAAAPSLGHSYAADRYSRTPSATSAIIGRTAQSTRVVHERQIPNYNYPYVAPSLVFNPTGSRTPSVVTSRAGSATRRAEHGAPVMAGARSSAGHSYSAAHHLLSPKELAKLIDTITIGEDGSKVFLRFARAVGATGHIKALSTMARAEIFEDSSTGAAPMASIRFAKRQVPMCFSLQKNYLMLSPIGAHGPHGEVINVLGRSSSEADHLSSTLKPGQNGEGGTRRPSVANSFDAAAALFAKKGSGRSRTDSDAPLPVPAEAPHSVMPFVVDYNNITKVRFFATEIEIESKGPQTHVTQQLAAPQNSSREVPPSVISIAFADRSVQELCYRLLMCKAKGLVPPSSTYSASTATVTHTFGNDEAAARAQSPPSDFAAIIPGQPLLDSQQQPRELSRTVIVSHPVQQSPAPTRSSEGHYIRHPDYVVHEHVVRSVPNEPLPDELNVLAIGHRKSRAAPRIDFSKEVQRSQSSVTRVPAYPNQQGFPSVSPAPNSGLASAAPRPSPAPAYNDPHIGVADAGKMATVASVTVRRPEVSRSSSAATTLSPAMGGHYYGDASSSRISASPVPIPLRSPSEGGQDRPGGLSREERKMLLIQQLVAIKAATAQK